MVSLFVQNDQFATFVGQGEVNPGELLGAYSDFLNGGPTRLALWDLSSATLARIDSPSIQDLAKCMAQMAKGRHVGKAAVACSRAVDFGLARMLTTYLSIEEFPAQVAAFQDAESARAWLTNEVIDV
jgi:hypothetical protein